MSQTHVFDYRTHGGSKKEPSHFGLPLSSVEIKLISQANDKSVGGSRPQGEIVVSGPAVAGSGSEKGSAEIRLGVQGSFGEDGCLRISTK